jgi:hypothetical protein
MDAERHDDGAAAEELLRRALLDSEAAVAVSVRVTGLALCDALTVIFHGRRDLGTIQTYVAHGGRGAGSAVRAGELLRVPCDLDLADASDRRDAEAMFAAQASAMRDALVGADTVLAIWREPLGEMAGETVLDMAIDAPAPLPAPRLMPLALVAPERGLVVAPVCSARTLAAGRPPVGIACAQQDVARIYPLPDDPERCLDDFLDAAADHARMLADRLEHQDASVERFLELNGEDPPLC